MSNTSELLRLGFRCIHPTRFILSDRSVVTVQAEGWLLVEKVLPKTEDEARTLRLYRVRYVTGSFETLDEVDVINLVGKEAFLRAV